MGDISTAWVLDDRAKSTQGTSEVITLDEATKLFKNRLEEGGYFDGLDDRAKEWIAGTLARSMHDATPLTGDLVNSVQLLPLFNRVQTALSDGTPLTFDGRADDRKMPGGTRQGGFLDILPGKTTKAPDLNWWTGAAATAEQRARDSLSSLAESGTLPLSAEQIDAEVEAQKTGSVLGVVYDTGQIMATSSSVAASGATGVDPTSVLHNDDPTSVLLEGVDDTATDQQLPQQAPLTEENMRFLFGVDQVKWGDFIANENIKAQWNQAGVPQPGQPMVDTGFGDPRGFGVGTSGMGDGTQQSRIGLLDATEEIGRRSKDEITKAQDRMVAVGYLTEGEYRPGLADSGTRDAWQRVVLEAWHAKKPVTSVLAESTISINQARAAADAKAKSERTHQITDPRQVRFLANEVAITLLGRELNDDEARMIQERVQREEIRAEDASQTPGATFSQPNVKASVDEWLRQFRPNQLSQERVYQQNKQIASARGQKPAYVNREWDDTQWLDFATRMRTNNWSESQVFAAFTGTPFDEVDSRGPQKVGG